MPQYVAWENRGQLSGAGYIHQLMESRVLKLAMKDTLSAAQFFWFWMFFKHSTSNVLFILTEN